MGDNAIVSVKNRVSAIEDKAPTATAATAVAAASPVAAGNKPPVIPTSKKAEFINKNNKLPKELKDALNTLYWLFNTFGVEDNIVIMILEKWLEKKKKNPTDALQEVNMFTRGLQIQPPTEGMLPHLLFTGKDSRNIFNSAVAAPVAAPVAKATGGARRRMRHSTRRVKQTSRQGQTRHLKQMNKRR